MDNTPTLTPRRAQTREKLMDAAVSLFAAKGVLGASVEEICERAEFTRGAFYSNFADKDDLCLAVLSRQCARDLAAAEQTVGGLLAVPGASDSVEGLIESALRVFLAIQPRNTEDLVVSMELRLHGVRNPALRQSILALNDEVSRRLIDILNQALDREQARMSVPLDQAIDLLHAVYVHSGITALLHGLEPDDESRRHQLAVLLRSLLTVDRAGRG
ncbi:MAG TPA: TetR/AcrR family transcriptional regulator [Propionicimonas sp.]|nr:TetR/AcrR family transcriptional regulator [Propionicimonas sp.]HRA05729.1 TetR/AcrR family transcriptional regulator [Propionicimonas sp.]